MRVYKDENENVVVCQYESSNILQSIYYKKLNKLVLMYGKGDLYEYKNIGKDLYEEFENTDSQGKFVYKNLSTNKDVIYNKLYKVSQQEVTAIKENVEKHKKLIK